MGRLLIATAGAGAGLLLAACASQGDAAPVGEGEEADYRVSVEIPLDELRLAEGEVLKVDELLGERTAFDAEDFRLDEVVLIARGNGGAEANAELLVVEWRSGQVAIPPGEGDEWYEVRLPAPEEDLGGAWLVDVAGDATVDMVVAVLEPRPRLVAEAQTVYRTTTVYRPARPVREVFWIYDPDRYYVYHYHGVWPYRYYIGPWSYRYYDLAYRPYRYHYGPLYRPAPWRDRAYGRRPGRRYEGRAAEPRPPIRAPRRIAPELVQLRRAHPRLRGLPRAEPRTDAVRRAVRRQAQTPAPRAQRNPLQRADTTDRAQRSAGNGSRTLRRPAASRQARSTTGAATRPSATARRPRPAASPAATPSRRERRPAVLSRSADRLERSPSAATRAAPSRSAVRRSDSAGATRSIPTVRSPRTVRPQTTRPTATVPRSATSERRASSQPRAVRPTARTQRSVRPQRTEPRRPGAQAQRPVRPSRPVPATRATPARRAQVPSVRQRPSAPAPRRTQPATVPAPAQAPARNARQARERAADSEPPPNPRSRRFERR